MKPPDIPRLAIAYRRLVLWFGAQLFVTLASVGLADESVDGAADAGDDLIIRDGRYACHRLSRHFVAMAFYAYRTADALGSRVPILWVVSMVLPGVSLFALLALSSRAATICQANGISVGLFGPKLPS